MLLSVRTLRGGLPLVSPNHVYGSGSGLRSYRFCFGGTGRTLYTRPSEIVGECAFRRINDVQNFRRQRRSSGRSASEEKKRLRRIDQTGSRERPTETADDKKEKRNKKTVVLTVLVTEG